MCTYQEFFQDLCSKKLVCHPDAMCLYRHTRHLGMNAFTGCVYKCDVKKTIEAYCDKAGSNLNTALPFIYFPEATSKPINRDNIFEHMLH